jgi:hypothetical protein
MAEGLFSEAEEVTMSKDQAVFARPDNATGPNSLDKGGEMESPVGDSESGGPFLSAELKWEGKEVPAGGQFETDTLE